MKKACFLLSIFLLSLSFLSEGEAAVPVLKIRHWSDARIYPDRHRPGRTDSLSRSINLRVGNLDHSNQRGVYCGGEIGDRDPRSGDSDGDRPSRGTENAEIRISLAKPARYKIFTLTAAGEPDRLVIDVFRPGAEPSPKTEIPAARSPQPGSADKPRRTAASAAGKTELRRNLQSRGKRSRCAMAQGFGNSPVGRARS